MTSGSMIITLCLTLVTVTAAAGAERGVELDPEASKVTFTLSTTFHDVRGTLKLTRGAIRFDTLTGDASGEIEVDARSAGTQHEQRDRKMHDSVLETQRFPVIVFRADRVEGRLVDPGRSALLIVGVMRLHGTEHVMRIPATVTSEKGRVLAEMRFSIPYVEWGMLDPSFLFVRAAKTVDVLVGAEGRWIDSPVPPP